MQATPQANPLRTDSLIVYMQKKARFCARSLVRSGYYSFQDFEDIVQDLLLDALRRLDRFDSSRGNPYVFVAAVMKNEAAVLAKRTRNIRIVSIDVVDRERAEPDVFLKQIAWRRDIRKALSELSPTIRRLAKDLSSMTVAEICIVRGKSRARIYQMREEIRRALVTQKLTSLD
jgi:RNA polymerase sigma factor (sigma-70 family)